MTDMIKLGTLLKKVEFWTCKYQISLFSWGEDGGNDALIQRNEVDLAHIGTGRGYSVEKVLTDVVAWCEKANPRTKYPPELNVEALNKQPE